MILSFVVSLFFHPNKIAIILFQYIYLAQAKVPIQHIDVPMLDEHEHVFRKYLGLPIQPDGNICWRAIAWVIFLLW